MFFLGFQPQSLVRSLARPLTLLWIICFSAPIHADLSGEFEYGPNSEYVEWEAHLHEGEVEPQFDLICQEEVANEDWFYSFACTKATPAQTNYVNQGNAKKNRFLNYCLDQTGNSPWCYQILRPNPSSINTFRCTYGSNQPHQLIHPDENTWKYAIEAVKIVNELENKGIDVAIIYNWWRPEPYNANVGGAAGRHPYGTSIDVSFNSITDKNRAHTELCRMRRQGRIRAVGYYPSPSLHFGVGDRLGNTWGKACP